MRVMATGYQGCRKSHIVHGLQLPLMREPHTSGRAGPGGARYVGNTFRKHLAGYALSRLDVPGQLPSAPLWQE